MTHDDIISMAREAGVAGLQPSMGIREADLIAIVRFAELIQAKVRLLEPIDYLAFTASRDADVADALLAERKKTAIEMQQLRDAAMTAEKWRGIAVARDGDGRTVSTIEREALISARGQEAV